MWIAGLRDLGSGAAGGVWRMCYRKGHRVRGRPPGEARTLQQRLEQLKMWEPITSPPPTNIGFPALKYTLIYLILVHNSVAQCTPEMGWLLGFFFITISMVRNFSLNKFQYRYRNLLRNIHTTHIRLILI
jgi:hypothetical protein